MEKALFLCSFVFFLKSLLITYLITLSVEKKYIVLEKSWILDQKSAQINPMC